MEQEPNELIKNAAQWTAAPLQDGPVKARDISKYYLKHLVGLIQSDPGLSSELTPLIGQIKGIQESIRSYEQINWLNISNGCIGIGPKPKDQLIRDLALHGNVQIVSLLTEEEGASDIRRTTKDCNLKWRGFDLPEDQLPKKEQYYDLTKLYIKMMSAIQQGKCLYIHCSDGIFRSGMIAYSLLQSIGYPPKKAKKMLKELSKEASKEMGKQRYDWADESAPELIKIKKEKFLS